MDPFGTFGVRTPPQSSCNHEAQALEKMEQNVHFWDKIEGSGMSESVFTFFFQVLFGVGYCFVSSKKQMTLQNYFLCWHRPTDYRPPHLWFQSQLRGWCCLFGAAFRQRWKAATFPSSVMDDVHVTDGKVFRVVSKKHYTNIKRDSSSEVLVMKVISMRTQYQNSDCYFFCMV